MCAPLINGTCAPGMAAPLHESAQEASVGVHGFDMGWGRRARAEEFACLDLLHAAPADDAVDPRPFREPIRRATHAVLRLPQHRQRGAAGRMHARLHQIPFVRGL